MIKRTNLGWLALAIMVAGMAASQNTTAANVTPGSFQNGTYSFPGNVGAIIRLPKFM